MERGARDYYEFILLGNGDASQEVPEPPDELILLWDSENYHSLPWPGGLLNQPHVTMGLMNLCANIRYEIERVKESQTRALSSYARQPRSQLSEAD